MKLINKVIGVGALMISLGLAGVAIGSSRNHDLVYKIPGCMLASLGGLTCARSPDITLEYIQRKRRKLRISRQQAKYDI